MKEQIMIVDGIAHNEENEIYFFQLIGYLNKENNIFRGIEINLENLNFYSLERAKEYLKNSNISDIRLVCGVKGESFDYYTLDEKEKSIHYTNLKKIESEQWFGRGYILTDEYHPQLQNTIYKQAEKEAFVADEELDAFLSIILENQKGNFTWKGISCTVEEKASLALQKMKK